MTLQCPGCGGPHLGEWGFDHLDGCATADQEAATEAADLAQLQTNPGRSIRRPATAVERALVEAAGHLRRGQMPNTTVALGEAGERDRSICGWEADWLLWKLTGHVG